jgi:radical SAM superfamily enzyme YgiQ (UPF0313 family)
MRETNSSTLQIVLVGRRIEDNENLGLGYLRSALADAGFDTEVCYVGRARDITAAAATIGSSGADLVGLSLADGGSAFLPLALGELLHKRGFAGHVTCGGQFATLARSWLLERYPWLDSVVRFAGERPLVALAQRLREGLGATGVPGLTTRHGDGAPAPVLDPLPLETAPIRDRLPEILGHRAAHIMASRGCEGRCGYCSPAALQSLERAEGRTAGIPGRELRGCGIGGVRRRNLYDVCDEMAELWHERDVRYFYFVDEHLLPYSESDALELLSSWKHGLERRGVGRLGIGAMLRPDRLTPSVVDAFVELGLVRAFVGLELAGVDEARRFGRSAPSAKDLDLLDRFAQRGVATISNLMLVHPYSTPETIFAGIELLQRLPAGVFEVTQMKVYHGTRLHRRMALAGRLTGNPLRYGYGFDDQVLERYEQVFTRIRGEALWNYSIANRTHDAFLAVALARALNPNAALRSPLAHLEHARARVNRLYCSAYRRGLELALAGGGYAEAGPLIGEIRGHSQLLERELAAIERTLERALDRPLRTFSPMRAAATAAISLCMLGGAAAACHQSGATGDDDAAGDTDVDSDTDADSDTDTVTDACADDALEAEEQLLHEHVQEVDPCFNGSVFLWEENGLHLQAVVHGAPCNVFEAFGGLDPCPGDEAAAAMEAAVQNALDPADYPCLVAVGSLVEIEGGAGEELTEMCDAIDAACGELSGSVNLYTIVLDEEGAVIEVLSDYDDPDEQAVAECIESALEGLTFPCLAGMDVCHEYVIPE